MVHPLAGAEGFLRYIRLREGLQKKLLSQSIQAEGAPFGEALEAVHAELATEDSACAAFAEKAFQETENLLSRVEKAAEGALHELREGAGALAKEEKALRGEVGKMVTWQEERSAQVESLKQSLEALCSVLHAGTGDPAWMSVELLRAQGRAYGYSQGKR